MADLVGQDAAKLALVHEAQDARRHRDRCVARVPSRGEGIWLGSIDDVQGRHRDARATGQVPDDALDLAVPRPASWVGPRWP